MEDEELVRVLKALADSKRFRMVQELALAGELSCGQLAGKFDLSQPTISHHLKQLIDAGVLQYRKEAQHHFITVNRPLVDEVASLLSARLSSRARRAAKPAARKAARGRQNKPSPQGGRHGL